MKRRVRAALQIFPVEEGLNFCREQRSLIMQTWANPTAAHTTLHYLTGTADNPQDREAAGLIIQGMHRLFPHWPPQGEQ